MKGKIFTRVIADDAGGRQFIAAVVSVMTNGYVKHCERKVQISLREEGSEFLYGEDDIKATMKASSRAEEYSIKKALEEPGSTPDYTELAVRSEQSFCGRIALGCTGDDEPDSIVVISGNGQAENVREQVMQTGNCHITVAVVADSPHGEGEDASAGLSTEVAAALLGREYTCFWYSPNGFMTDGSQRSAANAAPSGVEGVFWDFAGNAAQSKTDSLSAVIAESERTIGLRAGTFQKKSPRRQLELNYSRRIYSEAVREIFAAEQIAALAGGKPLAYEK